MCTKRREGSDGPKRARRDPERGPRRQGEGRGDAGREEGEPAPVQAWGKGHILRIAKRPASWCDFRVCGRQNRGGGQRFHAGCAVLSAPLGARRNSRAMICQISKGFFAIDSRPDNRDDLFECCSVLKVQLREVQNHENHQKMNFGGAACALWRLGDEGLRPLSPPAPAFGVPGAPPPDPRPAGGCLWLLPLLRVQRHGSPVTLARPSGAIRPCTLDALSVLSPTHCVG